MKDYQREELKAQAERAKQDLKSDRIVVWFSCGAASAVAAKLTLEKYPGAVVRVVNSPIAEEDADNRRFMKDVESWLGVPIEQALNSRYPTGSAVEVWEDRQFMSSPYGAPCTLELKKQARIQWCLKNEVDYHVLGFTADEAARYKKFKDTQVNNTLPVLIDAGMTKTDCFMLLLDAGIKLPRVYDMGYPNANCIGCVKATSPTYWNHVRKHHPDVFDERAEQSKDIGARLVRYKGERIFLHELPTDARGVPMKNMQSECGVFCLSEIKESAEN